MQINTREIRWSFKHRVYTSEFPGIGYDWILSRATHFHCTGVTPDYGTTLVKTGFNQHYRLGERLGLENSSLLYPTDLQRIQVAVTLIQAQTLLAMHSHLTRKKTPFHSSHSNVNILVRFYSPLSSTPVGRSSRRALVWCGAPEVCYLGGCCFCWHRGSVGTNSTT